jgi:hypothetical protein
MNKGSTPSQWYVTELNKKLNIFSEYGSRCATFANNSWNHRGEKKLVFIELLIHFTSNKWDNIFHSDSKFWAIKENVISDITSFQDINPHLVEYSWKGIVQQYINESFYNHQGDDRIDIRKYYLKQMSDFIKQFDIFIIKYNNTYDTRKNKFILKYKTLNHMKNLRPILLFMNRYFYHIFSFSKVSLIKCISSKTKMFHETLVNHLTSPRMLYDTNETHYLKLMLGTMRRTSDLLSNKNHFNFVGLVLNNLFCKDIALCITEYI